MAFLLPAFLAGLVALAVPVAIHLIQREKKQTIAFPSLMFVRRVPYESVRRRKIRHWGLLALRMAALLLIVAAFARPFLQSGGVAAMAGGARELVVLVDRSYSMRYGDRWTRAQAEARTALAAIGPSDRASLVFFGTGADVALQSVDDRGRLESALAAATPGHDATRLAPALKVASTILAESSLPRKEIILISDFQKNGWTSSDEDGLPAGTTFTPVAIADVDTKNLSVTPMAFARNRFEGQERVTITSGVTNRGSQQADGIALALEVNGRVVETKTVSVAPQASAAAVFSPVTLTPGAMRVTARLGDDALDADNTFHALLEPSTPVTVLLAGSGGRGADDTYLRRALAIGQTPRFEVTPITIDALTDEALARAQVLIVHDAPLSDQAAARVVRFAERGGGVWLIAATRATWPQNAALAGLLGDAVDRSRGEAGRVSGLEFGHPVFAPFRAPRSGDFSSVRVYGYRRLTAADGARVLARYDDGQPALVERVTGKGRIMAWTTSVDLSWNDVALKPVFLPFIHQVVRSLAVFRDRPSSLTVGQVAAPPDAADAGRPRGVVDPAGRSVPLDASRGEAFEVTMPGFYEVRTGGGTDGPPNLVAVNVDLAESDLTAVDPATVATALAGAGSARTSSAGVAAAPRDDVTEQSQRLWWYLLLTGMLLLVAESVLANRMSGGAV